MIRTDIHRPSEIDPANYSYVTSIDTDLSELALAAALSGNMEIVEIARQEIQKYSGLNRESAVAYPGSLNRCDHCGASLRYAVIWKHDEGDYIVTGETCAEETMDVPDRMTLEVKRLRDRAAARSAKARSRRAAEKQFPQAVAILDNVMTEFGYDNGGSDQKIGYSDENVSYRNDFVEDVAGRFRATGFLTEGQANGIVKVHNLQIKWAEERKARQAEEAENSNPVVEGRIQIEGTVLSTRIDETMYGTQKKMLVRDDRGFKVWGSVPSSIYEAGREDRVRFTGTVTKSPDDEYFGFFKRPSKAELLD